MHYQQHHIITMSRLNRGLSHVRDELVTHGLWTDAIADVEVYLTWFGTAYGYQYYKTSGQIEIPAISLARLCASLLGREVLSLRDLLRHEYGHAVADNNRGLIRSRHFRNAFGTHHDDTQPARYDSDQHVTPYASTVASEDFAETFMYFIKHKGKLPTAFNMPTIKKKWDFVGQLCSQIQSGKRRWAA